MTFFRHSLAFLRQRLQSVDLQWRPFSFENKMSVAHGLEIIVAVVVV